MEGNLYVKFEEQLKYIKQNNLKLSLLNEQLNPKSKPLEMKIIDFNSCIGASIDRAENKRLGLRETSPFFMNSPNAKIFMSSNPLEMLKEMQKNTS